MFFNRLPTEILSPPPQLGFMFPRTPLPHRASFFLFKLDIISVNTRSLAQSPNLHFRCGTYVTQHSIRALHLPLKFLALHLHRWHPAGSLWSPRLRWLRHRCAVSNLALLAARSHWMALPHAGLQTTPQMAQSLDARTSFLCPVDA